MIGLQEPASKSVSVINGFRKLLVMYRYLILFQKFVCTTIRPTQLEYRELYNWDGSAEFVADYLNFETLEPPYELVSNQPTGILLFF